MRGAVHVAGLALGAGTSATSQLTGEEEEGEEEEVKGHLF